MARTGASPPRPYDGRVEQEVWSSFTHDPRHSEHAALRASDADRDVVREVLVEAYADGRLDREEFDARSAAVATARTLGDLPALLEGLVASTSSALAPLGTGGPGILTPAQIEERAVAKWREERRSAALGFVFASVITWTIWAAVMFGGFPWPLFVMLGTAEDHHSNPMKIALGRFKQRGGRFIAINPVRSGYAAIADEWIPIRPGTDGALFMALLHELLAQGLVDRSFLQRFTNAPQLVVLDEGEREGLFAFDPAAGPPGDGRHPHNKLAWDLASGRVVQAYPEGVEEGRQLALEGHYKLADGTRVAPAFQLLRDRVADTTPEWAEDITGIPSERIRQLAREVGISRPLLHLHLQKLEEAGLVTSKLELSSDGKALNYFEVAKFEFELTPAAIAQAAKSLTDSGK